MTGANDSSEKNRPLRAVANPVRLRILSMLSGSPLSATQVARRLDIKHASASYHLRQLEKARLIQVAEVRSVHGGLERIYRYAESEDAEAPHSPWNVEDLLLAIEALSVELRRRAANARPGLRATIDGEYWIPQDVWQEARSEVLAATRRIHAAAKPEGSTGTVRISVSALLFEMASEHGMTEDDS